jgi:thiamine biosynthesis protein ThiI
LRDMKLLALLSGGIDSPVAAGLMAHRGAEMVLLHMDNRPFGSDLGVRKVEMLAEALRRCTGQEMPLFLAPHGMNQAIFREKCQSAFQCVLCKRLMLRTAQAVARNVGAVGIVMGDSLGQVASQTLRNIRAEQQGLEIPVLRPLIGLDKLEIERLAKEMGTYGVSIMSDGSRECTAVPVRAITNASVVDSLAEGAKVDLEAMARLSAQMAVRI